MLTEHRLVIGDSRNLELIKDKKIPIHLVVTSPPYPMIAMWDRQFAELRASSPAELYETLFSEIDHNSYRDMHEELAKIWKECYDVLVDGGLMCVNIGDAARKNDGNGFRLYPNHSKVIEKCERIGFTTLPYILWKKPTNKPNAFLGSGFYPPNAYVTLDCEYILIFRKGNLRRFNGEEKQKRKISAYTKKERDKWFSQIWTDMRGTRQVNNKIARRTGAFPEELARRLIRMFSVEGDTILDPFTGTGTTMVAARELGRNSVGYEIENRLAVLITDKFRQGNLTSKFEAIFQEPARHR